MNSRRRTLALLTAAAAVAGGGLVTVAAGAATPSVDYQSSVSCVGYTPTGVTNGRLQTVKFVLNAGQTKTDTLQLKTTTTSLPGVKIDSYHLVWGAEGITGGSKTGDFFGLVGTANSRTPLGVTVPAVTNETWINASDTTNASYTFINHSIGINARVTLGVYAASASRVVTQTFAGTVCPSAWTEVGNVKPGNTDPVPAPTPVVTPTAVPSP